MDKQIFWLASYPKSGNTLLRFILISLFFTKDGVFSFDKTKFISQFDILPNIKRNKNIFGDEYNKIGNMNIFYKYINELQSKEALGFKEDFMFLKTHSGLFKLSENSFTTEGNTRGIIYILRDPRDVSISWSKHNGIDIDKSIEFMKDSYAYYKWPKRLNDKETYNERTIPKTLMSSWEKHVISWTQIKWKTPLLILKFEDLVYDKINTVKKIVTFFEKNYDFKFNNIDEKINNIIKTTEFGNLKKHEKENGFVEATKHNSFFSVGKKNQWSKKLNKAQINRIEEKFLSTMKKFKYK